MDWKGEIRPTYVDLPTDLKDEMRAEAAKRRMTLRAAVQEAFEAWLHVGKAPSKEHPDVEMLRRFLEIGSPEDISSYTGIFRFSYGTQSVHAAARGRDRGRRVSRLPVDLV